MCVVCPNTHPDLLTTRPPCPHDYVERKNYMIFALIFLYYVEEMSQTFLTATKEQLRSAAEKLKEMTPAPMNTTLEKESRADAVEKRDQKMFPNHSRYDKLYLKCGCE